MTSHPIEPAGTGYVPRRMPQLDSLRTFAVFLVMVHHFWPAATFDLPFGFVGVQLFFVLSGFLITGILWPAREAAQSGAWRATTVFRRFYARRFLRIFPLFYATLAVLWLVDAGDVRKEIWWHVSYLSNFLFAKQGWYSLHTAHLWSLAVEEQFYLVWPFVIVLTPRRWLLPTLVATAAVGPAYRWTGSRLDVDWMWTFTPPFANVDSLAMGGILACAWATDPGSRGSLRAWLSWTGSRIAAPIVMLLCAATIAGVSIPLSVFEYTIWASFFVWLIDGAGRGFAGAAGRVFGHPVLRYLGQISYGLYVFHPLVDGAVRWGFDRLGRPYPSSPALMFPFLVAATILAAAASWRFFEKPLNDLKERFDFRFSTTEQAESRRGAREESLAVGQS